MDSQNAASATKQNDQRSLYRDLRGRNQRKANLTRALDAQRRKRIDRVMRTARSHQQRKSH